MDRYTSSMDQGYLAFVEKFLNEVDLAHLLELKKCGLGDRATLEEAIRALREACQGGKVFYPKNPSADVYDSRLKALSSEIGQGTEWLNFERSRREAINVAFYIGVKDGLLRLVDQECHLMRAGASAASLFAALRMPDSTYNLQAQATTLGYSLTTVLEQTKRDVSRLQACWGRFDLAPIGIGIMNGANLPFDRHRLSRLLGFSAPVTQCRDGVWGADNFIELAGVLSAVCTNLGRFCEDLMVLSGGPEELLAVPLQLSRASRIMPHKKNPYAYAAARGIVSMVHGLAMAVISGQRTPSHQVDNRLVAYECVPRMFDLASELLSIAVEALHSINPDKEALACSIDEAATGCTMVVAFLVRSCGWSPKTAYDSVAACFSWVNEPLPRSLSDILRGVVAVQAGLADSIPAGADGILQRMVIDETGRQVIELQACIADALAICEASAAWAQSKRDQESQARANLLAAT